MRHGNETIEHRRADTRLGSVLLGSLECLAQPALDGIGGQNIQQSLGFRKRLLFVMLL